MTERIMYQATARVDGNWWVIQIHGLPDRFVGVTQSAIDEGWGEAQSMTREVIALLLDVPEDSFDIDLKKE